MGTSASETCTLSLWSIVAVRRAVDSVSTRPRAIDGPGPLTPTFPQLDSLIHRFITLLADTSDSRSSENRVADANMACRKLAVAHPILLLRYCLAVLPGARVA